jgi:two-component system OmpR family response regulator
MKEIVIKKALQKNILIVDDDPHIRQVLGFALDKAGFLTEEASDGKQAVEKVSLQKPDLMVLDIVMPEMDGLEACRMIRKSTELPIIFLSSRDDELDRIIGLEVGGDDYITKPFSPRELVARINVILKRLDKGKLLAQEQQTSGSVLKPQRQQVGRLQLDPLTHQAYWDEEAVPLTATEFKMLDTLMRHPSRVYTREDLMNAYSDDDLVNDRTIDSHIRRIRSKLSVYLPNAIETVHGVGYKMGSCQ